MIHFSRCTLILSLLSVSVVNYQYIIFYYNFTKLNRKSTSQCSTATPSNIMKLENIQTAQQGFPCPLFMTKGQLCWKIKVTLLTVLIKDKLNTSKIMQLLLIYPLTALLGQLMFVVDKNFWRQCSLIVPKLAGYCLISLLFRWNSVCYSEPVARHQRELMSFAFWGYLWETAQHCDVLL